MPNYQDAKIYKLVNDSMPGLVYYGSTVNTFARRLGQHKAPTNKCKSKCLFEHGTVQIFLVEEYPCENKLQLNARERFYIENNDCVNKHIPGRSKKEYYHDNHAEILIQKKEYYDANQDEISLRMKEYYAKNRDKRSLKSKEYYDANQDEILIKKKEYRDKNKDELNRKQRERYAKKKAAKKLVA